MSFSVSVRRIRESDISSLAAFEAEISRISFGGEAITDAAFHEKRIRKGMKEIDGGMFVMADGDSVCGWLWMEERTNFLTHETYANFRSLYLTEGYRDGRAADELMRVGMEYCRGIKAKSITGKVHIQNMPMRALYKRFGFQASHLTMEYKFTEK